MVHIAARSHFYEASQVHDADAVAHVMDHSQIMGNEQEGNPLLALQALQHVHDLDLDGYVQCRYGLITKYAFRLQGQCPGYAHALTLAAAEFMGIALSRFGAQIDLFQQLPYASCPFLRICAEAVIQQGFADDITDSHARIQGRIGILEYHLYIAPERRSHSGFRHILTLVQDGAARLAIQA
jgi:hypothetical protein